MENPPSPAPAASEPGGNGKGSLPAGRSIDLAEQIGDNESALLVEVTRALERGARPRRKRSFLGTSTAVSPLPAGCLGVGFQLGLVLGELARKCGEDQRCWQSEISRMRQSMMSTQTAAPSAAR